MSNSIILFSSLFGSVYLMSISLGLINRSLLENKKIPRELVIINGLTFVVSGYIFIDVSLSNLSHFKCSSVNIYKCIIIIIIIIIIHFNDKTLLLLYL